MRANRAWLTRSAQAIILVVVVALIAAAYVDHDERQSVVRLAATDIKAAASRLAKMHPFEREACRITRPPSDLHILAASLAAVEQLGTSSSERRIEEIVVRLAVALGLPVPDFSLGPGQIRPSTAAAAVHGTSSASTSSGVGYKSSNKQIASDLLSQCGNHQLGVLVLRGLASLPVAGEQQLDRNTVMRLAGEYNAQITSTTAEAALANYLYRELTYQVFQEFKFQLRPGA